MALTPAQATTIKAYILADPTLAPLTSGTTTDYSRVSAEMSMVFPAYYVYKRTAETRGIGLVVNYVAVSAMTSGNQTQLQLFYDMNPDVFDPNRSDVRDFLANTFSGALGGQGQATRDALVAFYKRNATRIESILATGNGAQATPSTLNYDGGFSVNEVAEMFGG